MTRGEQHRGEQHCGERRSRGVVAGPQGKRVRRERQLVDLAVFTEYAGGCSRYCSGHRGDKIRDSPRSDPIFRPLDDDTQQSESFVFRALRVVGTLLDAPKFFCFLDIANQTTRTNHGDIHIFRRICVSQTYSYVVMQLVHLRAAPIGKKPKRSIGIYLQRLNRPHVEPAIAIRRCKKCDWNISNKLAQLSQVTRFRVRHFLKHW